MQNIISLFTGTKWDILQELGKKPLSTSELADTLQTSQANISQQLKHLELTSLVKRKKSTQAKKHYTYHITKQQTYITNIQQKNTFQTNITNERQLLLATLLMHPQHNIFLTHILTYANIYKTAKVIAILNRKKPELLVLAQHTQPFREIATSTHETLENTTSLAVWSHTPEEFKEGIARKEPYFIQLIEDSIVAYDPEGEIGEIQ